MHNVRREEARAAFLGDGRAYTASSVGRSAGGGGRGRHNGVVAAELWCDDDDGSIQVLLVLFHHPNCLHSRTRCPLSMRVVLAAGQLLRGSVFMVSTIARWFLFAHPSCGGKRLRNGWRRH